MGNRYASSHSPMRAQANFTGIGSAYERPDAAEIVLTGESEAEVLAARVVRYLHDDA